MFDLSWSLVARAFVHALVVLVLNPFFYVGWILYVIALMQEGRHQRRFFGIRLTRVRGLVWPHIWRSWVIGLALSIVVMGLGIVIHAWDVWIYSAILIVLSVIRLRLAAAPTAIGLLVLLAAIGKRWTPTGLSASLTTLWKHVAHVPAYSWLCLGALACLTEAIVLWSRRKHVAAQPIQLNSKRGRIIGAISVQLLLVIPVFLVVPGDVPRPTVVASWPWLGQWSGSLAWTALPLMLGIGGMFTSVKAQKVVSASAWHAFWLFVVSGGAAALALWYPAYSWVGGIILFIGREVTIYLFKVWEQQREPLYVPSSAGVRVLAVVEGSLADAIGLHAGEVITHVNQVPIHSEYDLHFAYSQNPAYAKLQVLDEQGEVRMLGKPVYDGERVKLGVVATPDGLDGQAYARSQFGLLGNLYARFPKPDRIEYDDDGEPLSL